jgi:two-component system phosphate regulon sensor histidine kinase PhoR
MHKRSNPSLLLPTIAVVVPLLTMAALAWMGLKAQSQAIWDEKREEAIRLVEDAAERLARKLADGVLEFETYPDPPVPGTASPADAILDGTDHTALIALRESADAGLSPAGLPRRVLAALRLLELDPPGTEIPSRDSEALVRLATLECPSILTSRVLEEILPTSEPALARWEKQAEVRELLNVHPEGGWLEQDPGCRWLEANGEKIRYLDAKVVSEAIADLSIGGYIVGNLTTDPTRIGRERRPMVSASAPVPFTDGLKMEIIHFNSPILIDAAIRRQRKWAAGLLAVAAAVSLGGLLMIHRTLRRERQLNEMKSQFVASVSHELRAPVASIRLMADALEAEKVAPETAKEFHRLIAREGARLSTLVGNVLDHARIEQGKRVWKMEPCDLESLVADTLRVMEPLANEKSIELRSALSPLEAAVDAGAIQQALVNLLDNAIKFSPAGSTVETSLSNDEERRTWRIAVRDEGPGIAKAEQARIFERFYRPGDELRRETQGTGIGLSLVKAIAEAHGGSVSVDSEPGQGSRFTLTFPLVLPLITDH